MKNKTISNLQQLISMCKASVTLEVNNHIDSYMSVAEYISDLQTTEPNIISDIGIDVFEEMKRVNTIIELQAYPLSPIVSYKIYHYDVDHAINKMIFLVENYL